MKNIERFIKQHNEEFNDKLPPEGHFERFEARLNQQSQLQIKPSARKIWMSIAAGLVILVTTTFAFIALFTHDFSAKDGMQGSMAGLPEEMKEIFYIYQQRNDLQMAELNQLVNSCDHGSRLIQQTNQELNQYDQQISYLANMARTQPGNTRVQNALIQQYKAKETILNDAILQGKIKKCKQ